MVIPPQRFRAMKLSSDLSYDFPPQIRERGADYYRSGAVRIDEASETHIKARVNGAKYYRVEIECTPKTLTLWCDCPYFDSTGPCKHVWAVILAVEAKGHLQAASETDPETVTYDYDDADYEDDEDTDFSPPIPFRSPSVPTALPAPKAKVPAWREHLQEVVPTVWRPETWPPSRELLYVVDVSASSKGGLVLKLLTRE